MKKNLLCVVFALTTMSVVAQGPKYDSTAIFIIDRMSDVIGDLTSCTFKVHVSKDENDPDKGLVRYYGTEEAFMAGPDKMLVNVRNHKGHSQYLYNGSQIAYYSFTENNYGLIEAPGTTMETIDKIHDEYGVNFPAADFFYPTFTDDLIAYFDEIRYVGKVLVEDKECFQIFARNKDVTVQLWISNDAFTLPAKMLIVKSSDNHANQEFTYSNWAINPDLPEAMFDFLPPAGASRLRIVAKSQQ
ncbi:DUF2092 domain-containing protein [Chryseolinea sp. T2]|uniref:DUF2092 domain-containing protein n=1 Tax=Chryseolinea sp. T2 TaxID=3129255 RepID=UPI0030786C15